MKGLNIEGINENTILGNWFGGKELSGGQWQKIAILRSIYSEKELLIVDEPTSNLDIRARKELLQFLVEESKRKIIILATHDDIFNNVEHKTVYI